MAQGEIPKNLMHLYERDAFLAPSERGSHGALLGAVVAPYQRLPQLGQERKVLAQGRRDSLVGTAVSQQGLQQEGRELLHTTQRLQMQLMRCCLLPQRDSTYMAPRRAWPLTCQDHRGL